MSTQASELAAFFFFNPLLGDESTEGEKILYFYPPSVDLNAQKDYVGICEGLIHFTREFGAPADAVHCQKHRYALFECEPDHWVVLIVRNAVMTLSKAAAGADGSTEDDTERLWLEDDLDDAVLQALVRRAYRLFRLFGGPILAPGTKSGSPGYDADLLRRRLADFVPYYISSTHFSHLRFFTDIHGFQYLPVDKATFLTVQYVMSQLRARFPAVRYCAAVYEGQIIWSGIDARTMFLLYSLEQEAMNGFYDYLSAGRVESADGARLSLMMAGSAGDSSHGKGGSSRGTSRGAGNTGAKSRATAATGSSTPAWPGRWLTGPYRQSVAPVSPSPSSSSAAAAAASAESSSPPPPYDRRVIDGPIAPSVYICPDSDDDDDDDGDDDGADGVAKKAEAQRLALLVYKYRRLTLFFLAADDADGGGGVGAITQDRKVSVSGGHDGAASSAPSPSSSPERARAAFPPPVLSPPATRTTISLSLYWQVDMFLRGEVGALADMLQQQGRRARQRARSQAVKSGASSTGKAAGAKSGASAGSPASGDGDDGFRFLYFNHMNLALKTSLRTKAQPLNMETIKLIRNIHRDFGVDDERRRARRRQRGCQLAAAGATSWSSSSSSSSSQTPFEVCVQMRGGDWVVGRRSPDTQREVFILFDAKSGNLADIQGQIEQLSDVYFYNVFHQTNAVDGLAAGGQQ